MSPMNKILIFVATAALDLGW